ncbi:hypothetical protein K0C01_09420 [Salinarchaeum sp. IM2453]|uniref:DUF5790 family protein n=1 Tax=Salinarchaeum sp. IM2453 TaxID=2862870 RepID=UPI001C83E059|nr:DUF5790 family protein [Salinarchaeum sp. IM2453]QZA88012.1 hypothetical protein K0C01_09420 [Salinarchaeum sp. IM2453]
MSQSTLDSDEELFGEAANEIRTDVEESLADARDALPEGKEILNLEANNVIGVLNRLKSELDTSGAKDSLRDAKKWYTIGERAEAFDDANDLASEIEEVESLITTVDDAHEHAAELASTVPEIGDQLSSEE